jgi:hypothetical protein
LEDYILNKDEQEDTGVGAIFDIKLDDSDLLALISKPITESENYWDNTFGLKEVRRDNTNLWLPKHYEDKSLYEFQEEYAYQDNRVFTSVETIKSVVNTRIAQPEVMPAQDTITSLQLAKDLGDALFAHSKKYQTDDIFRMATHNLMIKRVGWVKLRFDPNVGEHGDIVPEHVLPEDIVVDKDAKWNEEPRFYAHRIKNKTGSDLLSMYPEKRQEIYKLMGVNRRNGKGELVAYKSQMAKSINLWEVWFTYYDEEKSEYAGGVAVVDERFQVVLDKQRNPNWNYDEENTVVEGDMMGEEGENDSLMEGKVSNILDRPTPPFIVLNYLNDGSSFIDQTTMVEQAAPLQRILDRRGFQIMENAEMSGSGMIFNTLMIQKEDIAKLIGSPDEKVGVKGDVRSAFTRIPPPPLPNYVIEDKMDARREIDTIFATHDISRGEGSNNKTLGQDKLQLQQNITRMDDLARAVERAATRYYRYLVQMMKVYYTEDHYFKASGEDGQFDFITMRADLIEDGIDIAVEAGSTMPIDRESQMKWVETLIGVGMIDPLTVYEVAAGGHMPSPKKMLERFVTYQTDPTAFIQKVQDDDFDRAAFMDIQILNGGEIPKQRDEYSPVYFKFINNYMLGGDFQKQPGLVKRMYVEHIRMAQEVAAQQLSLMESQMPTPEEMQVSNQKALEQSQMQGQMQSANMQGQPQPSKPGEGKPSVPQQAPPSPQQAAQQMSQGKPLARPPVV